MAIDTKVLSQRDGDRSLKRIKELLAANMSQAEIVQTLNEENYRTLRLKTWTALNLRQVIWKLRHDLRTWYGLAARRAGLIIKPLPEEIPA